MPGYSGQAVQANGVIHPRPDRLTHADSLACWHVKVALETRWRCQYLLQGTVLTLRARIQSEESTVCYQSRSITLFWISQRVFRQLALAGKPHRRQRVQEEAGNNWVWEGRGKWEYFTSQFWNVHSTFLAEKAEFLQYYLIPAWKGIQIIHFIKKFKWSYGNRANCERVLPCF